MTTTQFKATGRMGSETLGLCLPPQMQVEATLPAFFQNSRFQLIWEKKGSEPVRLVLTIPNDNWMGFSTNSTDRAAIYDTQEAEDQIREALENLRSGKLSFSTAAGHQVSASLTWEGMLWLTIGEEIDLPLPLDTLSRMPCEIQRDTPYPLLVDGNIHVLSVLFSRNGGQYVFIYNIPPAPTQYMVEKRQFDTLLHTLGKLWLGI